MKSEIADFAEHIFGVIPVAVKLKDVTIVGQKLLEGIDAFVRSKLRVRNREIKEDDQSQTQKCGTIIGIDFSKILDSGWD